MAVRNEIGLPQPSSNAGPTTTVPDRAGNSRSSSPASTRSGSSGNSSTSAVPSPTPAIMASLDSPRLTASSPPTALSVNPNDSWIGAANRANNISSREKSGSVPIRTIAWARTGPMTRSSTPW